MKATQSNLSLIMDYSSISSKELSAGLGIDPSLISRWKSGVRRLSPDGFGAKALAEYFLARAPSDTLAFLRAVCPVAMKAGKWPADVLRLWLCQSTNPEERLSLLSLLTKCNSGCQEGSDDVRRALSDFLDYAQTLPEPGKVLFACPAGLAIFTRDSDYNLPLQAKLARLFRRGFHLQVVLRTDYRISDVALACGPWLRSHLLEYIQSCYYDDFCLSKEEKIFICLPERLAIEARVSEEGIKTSVWTSAKKIKEAQLRFESIRSRAVQRFRYHFFDEPNGFLSGVRLCGEKPVYLFERLPCFGVADEMEMCQLFGLSAKERARLHVELAPLLTPPYAFSAPVYQLIDAGAVDNALDHDRLVSRALSRICVRRVFLSAKQFALQLVRMRKALKECSTYHLVCLNREAFDQIGMELGVWGNEAAIAWLSDGRNSTACKDYPNVSALQGFCATVWKHAAESKSLALERLDTWIRRAQKMRLL